VPANSDFAATQRSSSCLRSIPADMLCQSVRLKLHTPRQATERHSGRASLVRKM
jgi:hypothetical protein